MSFRNILKPHNHKKSAISKKDEREFEREIRKLEGLEENTKKVFKDIKKLSDTQSAQCRCESRIVQNLSTSSVCRDDIELQHVVSPWQQTALHLETLAQEQIEVSQRAMAEPMKKYSSIFPSVANSAKKREQFLQEYTKSLAKMEKYQEKERTGSVLVKREAAKKGLNTAKEDFEAQNSALMTDMPQLYDGRIDYIEPSFQALVKSQIKYYTEAHKAYSELEAEISTENRTLEQEEFIQFTQQKLTDIRALSITADD